MFRFRTVSKCDFFKKDDFKIVPEHGTSKNSCDKKYKRALGQLGPELVSMAYTEESVWRNRTELITGRREIQEFLTRKWNTELDYRLIKEVWGFRLNRIAVRFAYESHDGAGNWIRSYGNENWEFDP